MLFKAQNQQEASRPDLKIINMAAIVYDFKCSVILKNPPLTPPRRRI